mgnify:CR=1 FL=1
MATFNKFNSFSADILKAVHNFTSDSTCTIMVALTSVAPIATNSVLADLTQISYTNLSSRVVTGVSVSSVGGIATLNASDLTLTASGAVASFQYVVFYNDDSASKSLIGYWDYGSAVTMSASQTFLIQLPTEILTIE